MDDREKVIKGLDCCIGHGKPAPRLGNEPRDCENCPYSRINGINNTLCFRHLQRDALSLLKAQEQEISRLKHHVDCDAAEKLPSGCVGYGRGFNDDEPCETCKACEKYNGYGEK